MKWWIFWLYCTKCQPGWIKRTSWYCFVAVMNPLAVPSPSASPWEWWSWWLHQVRAKSERQLIEAVSDSCLSFSLGYLSFSFGSVFSASVLDPSSLLLLWWVTISCLAKSCWRIKCFRVQPIFEIIQLGMEPQLPLHLSIISSQTIQWPHTVSGALCITQSSVAQWFQRAKPSID